MVWHDGSEKDPRGIFGGVYELELGASKGVKEAGEDAKPRVNGTSNDAGKSLGSNLVPILSSPSDFTCSHAVPRLVSSLWRRRTELRVCGNGENLKPPTQATSRAKPGVQCRVVMIP
jgi:hypothetical protein